MTTLLALAIIVAGGIWWWRKEHPPQPQGHVLVKGGLQVDERELIEQTK